MANDLSDIAHKILARGLKVLRNRCVMPQLVTTDFANEAAGFGDTINVPYSGPKTAKQVTTTSAFPTASAATHSTVPVSLNQWYYDDFSLSDKERMEMDTNGLFLPAQVEEAFQAVGKQINLSVFNTYKKFYGYVGTAGTTPFASTADVAADAAEVLNNQLAPLENRRIVLNTAAHAKAVKLADFHDVSQAGTDAVKRSGTLVGVPMYGYDWYWDQQVVTHTAGSITTGLIAKASTAQVVGDTTIVCTTAASTGACALKEGDIIVFAGHTQTYTLTADATQATAATDVTLNISPGLQVALAGSEAVTVKASHVVNLAFNRGAIALAMRPLADSSERYSLGASIASMRDPVTGLTFRLTVARKSPFEVGWFVDALWGVEVIRPELGCRIAG